MNHLNLPYPWIREAVKHLGLKEIPGPRHNNVILGWLSTLKAWWKEDETPWCGVFVAHCVTTNSMRVPKYWMRAKAWADEWGMSIKTPVPGCVVVFERAGGGHVGFVIGQTRLRELVVLGGNQGNMVNLGKFDTSRVVGYYWPKDYAMPDSRITLPILEISGPTSVNEA